MGWQSLSPAPLNKIASAMKGAGKRPDEVKGVPGELIDRFIWAIDSPSEHDWSNLGFYVRFALGGDQFAGIDPDTGKEPAPGTVGAKRRETRRVVSRDEYISRMEDRLAELVLSGVREDFLVRALRDELTGHVRWFADVEEGTTRRQEMKESIERDIQDPDFLANYRKLMARRDPEAGKLDDKTLIERLRDTAEHIGKPVSREQEREAWEASERWNERAAVISDDVLATWRERFGKRITS